MINLTKKEIIIGALALIGVTGTVTTLIAIKVIRKTETDGTKKSEEIPQKPKEIVRTVEWYQNHREEKEAMLNKCGNNPGELESDPNCVNAKQAEVQDSSGGLFKLNPE